MGTTYVQYWNKPTSHTFPDVAVQPGIEFSTQNINASLMGSLSCSLKKICLLILLIVWKLRFRVEKQSILDGSGGTSRRQIRKEQWYQINMHN